MAAYTPNTWTTGDVVTKAKLDRLEAGAAAALASADAAEVAQDAAAALFTAGTHTGISFTYDDAGNKVNAVVSGGGGGVAQAALDSATAQRAPSVPVRPPVNWWIHTEAASVGSNAWPKGMLRAAPVWLPPGTYDAVSLYVDTAGSAGAVAKIVVYGDNDGYPGTLLVDTATVDTSTTGVKQIVIGTPIVSPAGGRFVWAGTISQGSATTDARTSTSTAASFQMLSNNGDPRFATGSPVREQNGITGAAPTTFTGTTITNGTSVVAFRRSA